MPKPHCLLLPAAAACALAAPAAAQAAPKVIEQPVSFTVQNTNDSKLPCDTGLGEFFWRYKTIEGYDFVSQMAARGHVSVSIDRLGYGRSGTPETDGSCIGGQASIAHQIVEQLKSGDYTGSRSPAISTVGLVGHSAGGLITQVEAYSYSDVKAIGVLAYADQGISSFQASQGKKSAAICAAGGDTSQTPLGYTLLGQTPADGIKAFFASATPAIRKATTPQLTANPCGDLSSYMAAPAVDKANLASITVPTLLVQGTKDALFPPPAVKDQVKRFSGSSKVTYKTESGSGHALTLEATHAKLVTDVSGFLKANGL